VTDIGAQAFYQSNLYTVTIPDRVTNVGSLAFYSKALTSMTFLGNYQSFEHHCHDTFQWENGVCLYDDARVGIVAMPADAKWQHYTRILKSVNTQRCIQIVAQISSTDRERLLAIKRSMLASRTLPWRDKPQIAAMLNEALLGASSVFG
jgi:hypothetical protein